MSDALVDERLEFSDQPAGAPTHEDIAIRAFGLYEARGGFHGQDVSDWLTAEHELLLERARLLERAETPASQLRDLRD
ncbi:MAG TPA: DUF2934 domain-containing protein [Vicinamibacterales bacterium]|nr:DUF2934 domain-containing protein [Vicinamibacterales bacterium]